MIRRGFWVCVGAAGGIMGYRRATSVGRQVSQALGRPERRPEGRTAVKRHWARETIRFTRDVRKGMDLYIDRQEARSASTLGSGALAPSTRAPSPRVRSGHPQGTTDHDSRDEREDH